MSTQQAALKPTASRGTGFNLKQALWLVARLFGAFIAMLIAYLVSGALINVTVESAPPDAGEEMSALLIVSLISSLVLAYPILRSRWYGVKLMSAVVVVLFGVETFMAQIEALIFSNAVNIPPDLVMRLMAAGLVRTLVFAVLAVIVLGKFKGTPSPETTPLRNLSITGWIVRFAFLAFAYVAVYFAFGYWVAFQWAEVRAYYQGTFDFGIWLPLVQVVRGAIWAALALPIVVMMQGKAWEKILAVALVFGGLLSSQLLFPNPFMPPLVRQGHFFELLSSMLVYGALAGWVWTRKWGMKQE